ncbi:MAG TPA: carbon starvation protein A [Vicinamibacteria bacterium]|nr:carbon starvation protein A [Vicinamibacteria bacterium]
MSPVLAALCCLSVYLLGYHLYAKRIARTVFELDGSTPTPAHELRDEQDYVPCRRYVLFGHHYASIAGLAPMLGPAIAVMWGWVPAMLWVVLGTIFIGAVHDFSALAVSLKARGKSIGIVAEGIIGRRAKSLFHAIIFFLIALAMGVFVQVVAQLFSRAFYPEAVLPSAALVILAVGVGVLFYKKGIALGPLTAVGFSLTLVAVYLGRVLPVPDVSVSGWSYLLLGYAFAASVLPVWLLLQPRDFLNSLLLYLGLAAVLLGFTIMNPSFVAPAFDPAPPGAPPLYPFVFIVIACGAVSGFHALVSSGTTAKQLDREEDAAFVGYGGMVGESILGLAAVLACTAGFASSEAWRAHYSNWQTADGLAPNLDAFITGSGNFLAHLGIAPELGRAFVALVAVSFALTTLDSATRLLRYNIEEVAETIRLPFLGNRYLATSVAVAAIGFFALLEIDGRPAGVALWAVFGTTNQVLAALTLLTVTIYLFARKKNYLYTLVPMAFMLVTTLVAMIANVKRFYLEGNYLLLGVGSSVLVLAVWLVVEGAIKFTRGRSQALSGLKDAELA